MYYDTIEEAIKAAPDCTHVLTTGRYWSYGAELSGKFQPVCYLETDNGWVYLSAVNPQEHDGSVISDHAWTIAFDRVNTPQPTTDQRVTAARFDTAAGRIPAHEFLEKGVGHMKDRARQRDAEDGERSMKRCVEAFNALEGTNLTETQGWRFMVMLKMARSVSGDFTADDFEDMAAYAGLAGESASMEDNTRDN